MAKTYAKKLKRGKNGIPRYVGYSLSKSGKRQTEKFYLGFDLDEAAEKEKLIQALWRRNCEFEPLKTDGEKTIIGRVEHWLPEFLEQAKAIAKGQPPKLPSTGRNATHPHSYLTDRRRLQDATGSKWELADESLGKIAREDAIEAIAENRKNLSGDSAVLATGVSLGEALDQFSAAVKKEFTLAEGLKPHGKKLRDQVSSIRRLIPDLIDLDLALLDLPKCQSMYDAVRLRPLSSRTNKTKRLTHVAAQNLVKCLTRFFDWLDLSNLPWDEPPKFRKITKAISELDNTERFQKKQKKEFRVIPNEHLTIISQYCRDNERVFLLLGLNCAFGENECGELRIPFIQGCEIDGIRFKTDTDMKHFLWDETAEALQETIKARPKIKNDLDQFVFVAKSGKPIYHRTKSGNYSNGISNKWNAIIRRVKKDHPEFPSYSFNKLRKTAATGILRLCSAESASMILAHNTISDDKLLSDYANTPWQKLYEAQKKWGAEILPLIPKPAIRVQSGGGACSIVTIKRIQELAKTTKNKSAIARELKISHMTVKRILQVYPN